MSIGQLEQVIKELQKKITFNTENLYVHTISLNVGSGRRIVFDIINNYGFDMTWAEVKKYIQDNYSASSADVITYARFMPCVGVSGNYTAIGFAWATNRGGWVICYPISSGIDWSGVSDDSNIYILSQKTRLLALNNVNKPSYKTVNTKLSLGGTEEGSANVNWTCYKYPLGDGKFKYEWVGRYKQSKSIAVTTGYGNMFMSPKISIALPDSNMAGKCILYAGQEASTCWVAPSVGGSALDFYLLRATSNTISNNLEINITCSYVANS